MTRFPAYVKHIVCEVVPFRSRVADWIHLSSSLYQPLYAMHLPRLFTVLLLLTGPAVLLGCDDDDIVGDDDDTEIYTVTFTELNDSGVSGTATLTLSDEDDLLSEADDRFLIDITANGLDEVVHPQHIHAAAECPTEAQDTNDDNFVDVVEGVPVYGEIAVPLDDNLLDAESNDFPEGNTITYDESADLDDFVSTYDAFSGGLDLESRTIVLHGVDADTDLPESVQSLGDLPATTTLPVACGTVNLAVND